MGSPRRGWAEKKCYGDTDGCSILKSLTAPFPAFKKNDNFDDFNSALKKVNGNQPEEAPDRGQRGYLARSQGVVFLLWCPAVAGELREAMEHGGQVLWVLW